MSDDVQQLLDRQACERLVLRYCHLIDSGSAASVADLFTEEGAWISDEATYRGRPAIARAFKHRQDNLRRVSRHVCSTILIDLEGAERASGVTYLTLYRHDGEPGRTTSPLEGLPVLVGEYRDQFERTPAGWLFSRREVTVVFSRKA